MSRGVRPVPLLALLMALVPMAANSQAPTSGTIQGTITERDGSAVPSASVRITRQRVAFSREVVTNAAGAFRAGFLAPGVYRVTVRRIGYRPTVVENVAVVSGGVTRLDLAIEPSALALDSVVVRSPPVTIDRDETEFGTRIGSRELSLLPVPNEARNRNRLPPRTIRIWTMVRM